MVQITWLTLRTAKHGRSFIRSRFQVTKGLSVVENFLGQGAASDLFVCSHVLLL